MGVRGLVLCLAFAMTAVAEAQGPSPRVIELYELAESLFQAGQYAEAASLLDEALSIEPHSILALNLARMREALQQAEAAVLAYEHYLRLDPEGADAAAVRRRIEELQAAMAASADPPGVEDLGEPVVPPLITEAADAGERPGFAWPISMVSLSAVAAAASGVVWYGALSARAKYDDPDTSRMDALEAQVQAERRQRSTRALVGVSACIGAAGLAWLIVQLSGSDHRVQANLGGIGVRF